MASIPKSTPVNKHRRSLRPIDIANRYANATLSILPIRADGTKSPSVDSWKPYQSRVATTAERQEWFGNGQVLGIGIIGGKVSKGLEIIDFDDPSLFSPWQELVTSTHPELIARLPIVATPSGGRHVFYRCSVVEGNQKLAKRAKSDPLYETKATLIETRGERGYVVAPGSPPACHATGKTYRHIAGPLIHLVPSITPDERLALLDAARSFNLDIDEYRPPASASPKGKDRPGDRFDRNADWQAILEPHDWTPTPGPNGKTYWTRPGKGNKEGHSATTGHCTNDAGIDLFYVFSSNVEPFDAGRAYTPFQAYTFLNHGQTKADFSAAAKALAKDQKKAKIATTSKAGGTETQNIPPTPKPLPIDDGKAVFRKWLPSPDQYGLEIVLGSIAGNLLADDPLWMFLISPPGGGKTELVNSLDGHADCVFVSNLTEHSLISGFRKDKKDDDDGFDPSMLPHLDGKVLINKDFTPILSLRADKLAAIFGQLRDIYDGKSSRWLGNLGHREYESRFNFISAVTPEIDRHIKAISALGERFLYYRLNDGDHDDRIARSLQALKNAEHEPQMRAELQSAAAGMLAYASKQSPNVPDEIRLEIVNAATILSLGRTYVHRDHTTKQIDGSPSSEFPTRIAKQLQRLAKGIAMFTRHATVGHHEMAIVYRVVHDSIIPRRRCLILKTLLDKSLRQADIAKWLMLPEQTTRQCLLDLAAIGLLKQSKTNAQTAHIALWSISPQHLPTIKRIIRQGQ